METIKSALAALVENGILVRLALIALGIALVLLLTSFMKKAVNRRVTNTDHRYRVRKAVNMIGYLLVVLILLLVYGDRLGNIGVALGVAGAGITFALQEVIVSFAGWLSMVLSGSPSVGQRVKIGDAKGDIIDIGMLKTTIMEMGDWAGGDGYNGRIITMANSFVFKESVHNYSAEYPFLWDEINVPIRTESDYKLARKVFTEVLNDICQDYAVASEKEWQRLANKFRVDQANVRPTVSISFDENWITFNLRYIVDYKSRGITKDRIYTALLDEISKYDNIIMIATSSMEVTTVLQKDDEDEV